LPILRLLAFETTHGDIHAVFTTKILKERSSQNLQVSNNFHAALLIEEHLELGTKQIDAPAVKNSQFYCRLKQILNNPSNIMTYDLFALIKIPQ
jgi:hypothetical protein